MGLKNIYYGMITGYDKTTGKPTVESFRKLYASGITNVSFSLTKEVNSEDISADDQTDTTDTVTGISGSFSYLGIDPEAQAALEGEDMESGGAIFHKATGTEDRRFVLFYEFRDQVGKKKQRWLYDVKISLSTTEESNQPGSQGNKTYNFTGRRSGGVDGAPFYATIPEGAGQYVTGEPTNTDIPYPTARAA